MEPSDCESRWLIDLTKLTAHSSCHLSNVDIELSKHKNNGMSISCSTTITNEYLISRACSGSNSVIAALWSNEDKNHPPEGLIDSSCFQITDILIPRQLPLPQPKKETKWQKFARDRGITSKRKRSRKVWDDIEQAWVYRTGFQGLSKKKSVRDKFSRNRELSNSGSEINNSLRLDCTNTSLKKKSSLANGDIASGIPVDLENTRKRGRKSTMMAILTAQTSTASMGKYDQVLSNEPLRRKNIVPKKKNINLSQDEKKLAGEIQGSIKLLDNLKTHISKKEGKFL